MKTVLEHERWPRPRTAGTAVPSSPVSRIAAVPSRGGTLQLGGYTRASLLSAWSLLCRVWSHVVERIEEKRDAQRGRRLRVLETVALGEKRFVAILQVQQAQFLIGGGPTGVSLLARLDGEHGGEYGSAPAAKQQAGMGSAAMLAAAENLAGGGSQ